MGTWLKRIELGALALVVLCAVAVFAVDAHVRSSAGPGILSVDEAAALGDVDCVLVLGCGVHPDGRPSDMLADRIACGVALYENGTSPKLLMSGDHGRADYDEVTVMREAAVQAGLPGRMFMDMQAFPPRACTGRVMCSGRKRMWSFPRYHLKCALRGGTPRA
ncbi:MAG: vancomycin high temperature exclusion protein [Adlercreutzia equolifaciens]